MVITIDDLKNELVWRIKQHMPNGKLSDIDVDLNAVTDFANKIFLVYMSLQNFLTNDIEDQGERHKYKVYPVELNEKIICIIRDLNFTASIPQIYQKILTLTEKNELSLSEHENIKINQYLNQEYIDNSLDTHNVRGQIITDCVTGILVCCSAIPLKMMPPYTVFGIRTFNAFKTLMPPLNHGDVLDPHTIIATYFSTKIAGPHHDSNVFPRLAAIHGKKQVRFSIS